MQYYETPDGFFFDHYGNVLEERPRAAKPGFTYRKGLWFSDAFTLGNYNTPQEANYSYGVHVVNGPVEEFKGDMIVCNYSDRITQWYGHAKWKRGVERVRDMLRGSGHKTWAYTPLPVISEFLSFVYGHKVECLQVLEGCNVGNGYPFNVFVTRRIHKPRKRKKVDA